MSGKSSVFCDNKCRRHFRYSDLLAFRLSVIFGFSDSPIFRFSSFPIPIPDSHFAVALAAEQTNERW